VVASKHDGIPLAVREVHGGGDLTDKFAMLHAGLDATMQAGLPSAASDAATAGAAGSSARLGALSASAAGQQQQQLMLGGGSGVVGVSPRSVANAAVQLQLPLRHAVSRELQVYFDRVVGLILTTPAPSAGAASAPGAAAGGQAGLGGTSVGQQGAGAAAAGGVSADKQATLLTGALSSVASDPGLHPLVPYFCSFIADGVKQHLSNLVVLERLLLLTRALLANPGVHLAPYLQQLLPAVMTCVVTKTIGEKDGQKQGAASKLAYYSYHSACNMRSACVCVPAWGFGGGQRVCGAWGHVDSRAGERADMRGWVGGGHVSLSCTARAVLVALHATGDSNFTTSPPVQTVCEVLCCNKCHQGHALPTGC